jgi:wyosine [tRNA(Phe)-imidazoG37] synthetase (radical SAM superfamily)
MIYGPVLSRRLGYSLGIDIIPLKICTYDCVYCQLGRTTNKTAVRKRYVDVNMKSFLKDLKNVVGSEKKIDHITFSGSGEPTLNTDIGIMIERVKKTTDIPVVVLTNGSLLYKNDVIGSLKNADLVKVSFDAPDEACFRKINRPSSVITFEKVIRGLKSLLNDFKGRIWLELMIIKDFNDSERQAEQFKKIIAGMDKTGRGIEKIHLNTPVRPSVPGDTLIPDNNRVKKIEKILGRKAEIIRDLKLKTKELLNLDLEQEIVELVKRRPASAEEISRSLQVNINKVIKSLRDLMDQNKIKSKVYSDKKSDYYYYKYQSFNNR